MQDFAPRWLGDDETAERLEKVLRCGGGLAQRGLASWVSGKVN